MTGAPRVLRVFVSSTFRDPELAAYPYLRDAAWTAALPEPWRKTYEEPAPEAEQLARGAGQARFADQIAALAEQIRRR